MKPAILALLIASTALAEYRLRAGEAVPIPNLREARNPSLSIHGPRNAGIVILPTADGGFALAASLTATPGSYTIEIRTESDTGEVRTSAVELSLNPPRPVPSDATRPPVVLLNGYQLGSLATFGQCLASTSTPPSRNTFGDLESVLLRDGAPIVYFFDNCVEAPRARIEDIGAALARTIAEIRFDNGAPVPQVDLVGHSMGGLIVRAYLAGMQRDGSFTPPANPQVRKFVQIATPNFGSYWAANLARNPFIAALLDDQARAMLPGSTFLWNLATWNQYGDDLRGVDALAIAGNRGTQPLNGASDGVVSLTSASLGFAREPVRTRVLPYCHEQADGIDCIGPSIARAAETATVVSSFLRDTSEWRSAALSRPADEDPYLSQFGGVYFTAQNAAGQNVTGLTSVSFGSVTLAQGAATGVVAYAELLRGTDTFRANAPSGPVACGPFTQPHGFVAIFRCKAAPVITSVAPALSSPVGRVVIPGREVTLRGSGFGAQRCAGCSVSFGPGGTGLTVTSWSDTAITASVPAGERNLTPISVQTASGADRVPALVITPPLAAEPATNGASFSAGFAASGWVTIKGLNLARTTRIWTGADIVDGNLPTSIDGVSVKVNGLPAYIYYVSPSQLNVLAPSGDAVAAARAVDVEVSTPDGFVQTTGMMLRYAPAMFLVGEGYAAAVHVDGAIVAPANAIPGVLTRPARPGDVVALYVTGMGTGTTPPVSAGRVVASPAVLNDAVTVTVGGVNAVVSFAGLVGSGLYQVNFTVPQVAAGNRPVAIRIAGVDGQNTGLIAVGPGF
jgi:uncharacterized protein (TIGR03437 family)